MSKVFAATVTPQMIASGLHISEMNPEFNEFFHGLYSWSVDYFCSHVNKETNEERDTEIVNCGIVREKLISWMARMKLVLTKSPTKLKENKGFQKGNQSAMLQANFRQDLKMKGK